MPTFLTELLCALKLLLLQHQKHSGHSASETAHSQVHIIAVVAICVGRDSTERVTVQFRRWKAIRELFQILRFPEMGGTPKWMVRMDNPVKMDDNWG